LTEQAFRYLTLQSNGTGEVILSNVSIHFTAYPQAATDLTSAYTGYFHSNDEELNAVWLVPPVLSVSVFLM